MSRQWRSAVVGVGVVGEWHVRMLSQMPNTKLIAVCDTSSDNVKKAFEKNNITGGVAVYSEIDAMLRSEEIDIVHVCTPSGNHLEPAIAAMNAGKHVISEKPLEIQLDRIDRMIEA